MSLVTMISLPLEQFEKISKLPEDIQNSLMALLFTLKERDEELEQKYYVTVVNVVCDLHETERLKNAL